MKLVLEAYGKLLLESAALVLLLLLLFCNIADESGNKGIFQIIGAQLDTDTADYASYSDFRRYETECRREKPLIFCTYAGALEVGTCDAADFLTAVDSDGSELPIKVISCLDADGRELCQVSSDTTVMSLTEPGIYRVTVSAIDAWNKKRVCTFQIPVN